MHGCLDVRLRGGIVAGAGDLAQPVVGGRSAQQTLERPCQRVRGRLVPGQDQAHQLVAQLVVGQRSALVIAGIQKQREHVVPVFSGALGAARADHAVDVAVGEGQDGLEDPARLHPADVLQLDQLVEGLCRGEQHPADRLAQAELRAAAGRRAGDAEHAAHDHVERDRRHPWCERERLTHGPAIDLALGDGADHLHVALDRLAVERGQQQLALAHVTLADGGEHGVRPEDRPQRRFTGQRGRVARAPP